MSSSPVRLDPRPHRRLWVVVLFSLLSACGFHLRGAVTLPPEMQQTYIQGDPSSNLVRDLLVGLEVAGVELVPSPTASSAMLTIADQRQDRRILTVSTNARVQEYELIFQVDFSVTAPDGRMLLPLQTVSVQRDYRYDADAVLGVSSEETILLREMQRDAAQIILRRLEYLKTRASEQRWQRDAIAAGKPLPQVLGPSLGGSPEEGWQRDVIAAGKPLPQVLRSSVCGSPLWERHSCRDLPGIGGGVTRAVAAECRSHSHCQAPTVHLFTCSTNQLRPEGSLA